MIWNMLEKLRTLFRREQLTHEELVERDRINRDAKQARYRVESEMAQQRGHIEGYLDRHPPDAGFGPGPF
jgi:hypothetical protein